MRGYRPKREHYIPQDAEKVEDPQSSAVAYTFTDLRDRPCAIGFGGKRQKPDFQYAFESESHRDRYIQRHFDNVRSHEASRKERKQRRDAHITTLQVGDILYTSWGYDQTNVEFYQVVGVTESRKSVQVQRIGSDLEQNGFMAGKVTPRPDEFIDDEVLTRRTREAGHGKEAVRISNVQTAWTWDGKPKYCSWYA